MPDPFTPEFLKWVLSSFNTDISTALLALVAQSDAPPTGDQEVKRFEPHRVQQHSFMEIDHEIFSMIILSLPLIQEGQMSVSGSCQFLAKKCAQVLVNGLED